MNTIPFSNVAINGGFWKTKQDMVRDTTVQAVYDRFTETHRFEALKCQWKEGDPDMPHIFWDSDVAKWIEGAAYLLHDQRDPALEALIDEAVDDIRRRFGFYSVQRGLMYFDKMLSAVDAKSEHTVHPHGYFG